MKYTKTHKWCVSNYGEFFTNGYDSKEEAIKAVKEDCGHGYVGRRVNVEFEEQDVIIPDIEDDLKDTLLDEVGECAEDWEFSKEQEKKFAESYEKFVIDFINKNGLQPTCFKVVDIEEVRKRDD